ncbi:hypothetical protein KY327_02675, partial [Candidatus Woesearchaeota archaeon]|nr:hypothetical protein [Candidatus Woesearchaeota archaeon]
MRKSRVTRPHKPYKREHIGDVIRKEQFAETSHHNGTPTFPDGVCNVTVESAPGFESSYWQENGQHDYVKNGNNRPNGTYTAEDEEELLEQPLIDGER